MYLYAQNISQSHGVAVNSTRQISFACEQNAEK